MDDRERYELGMQVRREVLGSEHVDRTLENLTPFNGPFQDFITRYAWGEVWARPGLPRHSRSLITLAMMVALNRTDEPAGVVLARAGRTVSRARMAPSIPPR